MASTSSHSQLGNSPLTGPSSLGSAVDPQGLSTVPEIPHQGVDYQDNGAMDNRLYSKVQASREGSPESSLGHSYNEKQSEASPRPLRYTAHSQTARQVWQCSQGPTSPYQNRNSNHRGMGPDRLSAKPTSPKKEKKGGLRNTLRRMFGRKSARDRISAPNATVYPRHVSLNKKTQKHI